jgi:predicted GNAT family acetyltransferase
MEAHMGKTELLNDVEGRRYRLLLDGAEVGFIEYDPIGDTSILIKHAEVAQGHEGKGLGSQLVRHALDDIRRQGLTVVPICPYTLNFIRNHQEYRDLVRAEMRGSI